MSAKAMKPVNQKRERNGSSSPDTLFTEAERDRSSSHKYTRSAYLMSSVYIRKHKK